MSDYTYVVIRKSRGWTPQLTRCTSENVCDVLRECKQLYPDAELIVAFVGPDGQIYVECAETMLAIDRECRREEARA